MTTVATAISSRLETRFAAELSDVDSATLVRRCADVAELLTVAEAGLISVAAISPDFPGMNGSVVAELAVRGADVLAVVAPTSPTDARQCESWGLRHVHVVGSGELSALVASLDHVPVLAGVGGDVDARPPGGPPGSSSDTTSPDDGEPGPGRPGSSDDGGRFDAVERSTGESGVIVVWSPPGSPGRTTCAVHLAHALSADGPTLLLDADTVAPACGPMLGLLDEAPGILAAARLIDAGTFNLRQLRDLVTSVGEGFDVLTGIGRASRWHELTRLHVESILARAREGYCWIVVDIASDISVDEALLYDTLAPARAGAGIEAIEQADVMLALTAADPIALQRFVLEWDDVSATHPDVRVVVSKARRKAVGGDPASVVPQALERFVGVRPAALLPDARDALDLAVLEAGLLTWTDPEDPYAVAVTTLAADLGAPAPVKSATSRSRRLRRRRA